MTMNRTQHPSRVWIRTSVVLVVLGIVMVVIGFAISSFEFAGFGGIIMCVGFAAGIVGGVWNTFSRR